VVIGRIAYGVGVPVVIEDTVGGAVVEISGREIVIVPVDELIDARHALACMRLAVRQMGVRSELGELSA